MHNVADVTTVGCAIEIGRTGPTDSAGELSNVRLITGLEKRPFFQTNDSGLQKASDRPISGPKNWF
jgi:hypothetical protein